MKDLNENVLGTDEMTSDELNLKKEEMLSFYNGSLSYLQAQHDYENILLKIDEVRFKRANIQMQFAIMMQENKEEEDIEKNDESDNVNIEKKRILKKS